MTLLYLITFGCVTCCCLAGTFIFGCITGPAGFSERPGLKSLPILSTTLAGEVHEAHSSMKLL